MQKLLNKLSSIFFQDFYSKFCENTKNVTLKFLSESILSPSMFTFLKDIKKENHFFELFGDLHVLEKVIQISSVQFR